MYDYGYIYGLTVASLCFIVVYIMESAFIRVNRLKLEAARKKSTTLDYITGILIRNAETYFSGLFICKSLAVIYIVLCIAVIAVSGRVPVSTGNFFIILLIATIFVCLLGVIARAVSRISPNKFFQWLSVPSFVIYIISFPFAKLAAALPGRSLKRSGTDMEPYGNSGDFDKEDLSEILEKASEQEQDGEEDKNIKLFQNALDFHEVLVRDCMVPRVDIEAVDKGTTIGELTERFNDTKFSRLPVYDGNIDNIIGYVTGKLLYRRPESISDIMTPVDYVPETMPAQRLLGNFIKKRHSIAVVIDEFGGTAGMVTLEDILEEIFGEIEDEHDQQDHVEKKIGDNEYIFSGRMEIERINEKYQLDIPESDDYDTLAGYVIYVNQDIPSAGDVITTGDKTIKIMRGDSSKIELIRLTVTPQIDN